MDSGEGVLGPPYLRHSLFSLLPGWCFTDTLIKTKWINSGPSGLWLIIHYSRFKILIHLHETYEFYLRYVNAIRADRLKCMSGWQCSLGPVTSWWHCVWSVVPPSWFVQVGKRFEWGRKIWTFYWKFIERLCRWSCLIETRIGSKKASSGIYPGIDCNRCCNNFIGAGVRVSNPVVQTTFLRWSGPGTEDPFHVKYTTQTLTCWLV